MTVDELTGFLKDPLKTHPSGRMPSMIPGVRTEANGRLRFLLAAWTAESDTNLTPTKGFELSVH